VTATGTVQGGTITDGTASITGGNISGVGTLTATTGNIGTLASSTINNSGAMSTNSLAVGTGGLAVAAGSPVNMGGNRIQNVAGPIAATDAANKAYVDTFLGASNAALGARIDDANARINKAFEEIDQNTEGIAIAIAMSGLSVPTGKNFALGANLGFYDDKQAVAAQTAVRLNDILQLNAGVGVGFDNAKVGGRVGFMAAW
jgi:hypothetical protein